MSELDMIQKYGEFQTSRFPEKHKFVFQLDQGLALQGHSDTWVSPPSVSMILTLNGAPAPAELLRAFNERTGRDLVTCAMHEVQRRLGGGDVTKTPRQELSEAMKDLTPGPGLTRALELINRLAKDADASEWKVSDGHYNTLKGIGGYLLDVSDEHNTLPFSCSHPNTVVTIGVSSHAGSPVIELGTRQPFSGSFSCFATIEGEPAQGLLEEVRGRCESLQAKREVEAEFLRENLVEAVQQGQVQACRSEVMGSTFALRGSVGSFEVRFSAPVQAQFDSFTSLRNPTCRMYTQAVPRSISTQPNPRIASEALDLLLDSEPVPTKVRQDNFDQESRLGKALLEKVEQHIRQFDESQVKEFYADWHAHRTTLGGKRWEIDVTKQPGQRRQELILVSSEGISVGCWQGGQSGGYAEAFLLDSPEAKRLAKQALERIEAVNQRSNSARA